MTTIATLSMRDLLRVARGVHLPAEYRMTQEAWAETVGMTGAGLAKAESPRPTRGVSLDAVVRVVNAVHARLHELLCVDQSLGESYAKQLLVAAGWGPGVAGLYVSNLQAHATYPDAATIVTQSWGWALTRAVAAFRETLIEGSHAVG